MNRKNIVMGLIVSSALVLSACDTLSSVMGLDTQTVNTQALVAYKQTLTKEGKIDKSSKTAKRIYAVFNKMKPYAEAENKTGVPFNWELAVIRSNTVNAWAMPGGKMAFYTGLVDKLKLTDNEIAAVMGHEMSHALLEHSKKQMATDTGTSLVVSAACSYSDVSLCKSESLVNAIKQVGISLPYSRSHEAEADYEGMFLMAKAGYDPKAAVTVQEKLSAQGNSGLAIFSSHPQGEGRVNKIKGKLPEAEAIYKNSKK